MHLSKLELNPRSNQVRSELANLYQLHRTLMQAFPDTSEGPGRVLFRLEPDRRDSVPLLLIQSECPPDWSHHRQLDGYLASAPQDKPYEPEVSAGQTMRFRLLANPTVCRDGKRQGILEEEDQLDWLRRQADRGGFRVEGAMPQPKGFVRPRKKGNTLTFYSVLFDGGLAISDRQKFVETIASGIGPGKAFGFGLLSAVPLRSA